jgi:hypothetical protein
MTGRTPVPLFKCNQCGCIENTEIGAFWTSRDGEEKCSECQTGKWHGYFPKRTPEEAGFVKYHEDFYCRRLLTDFLDPS